jgi:ketosteroid isomerase-like protein
MRTFLLTLSAAAMLVACNECPPDRYTQKSPEIDKAIASNDAYCKRDWEALKAMYAPDAKIYHNSTEPVSVDVSIAEGQEAAQYFSSETITTEDVEMVVTDSTETWVNFWGIWKGVMAANGKEYTSPMHMTMRFENGLITEEHGYWDSSSMMQDFMAMDTAAVDTTAVPAE